MYSMYYYTFAQRAAMYTLWASQIYSGVQKSKGSRAHATDAIHASIGDTLRLWKLT